MDESLPTGRLDQGRNIMIRDLNADGEQFNSQHREDSRYLEISSRFLFVYKSS
jgi:hypothetical protein